MNGLAVIDVLNTVLACSALVIAVRSELRTRRQERVDRLAARERATVAIKRLLDAAEALPVKSAADLPMLFEPSGRSALEQLSLRAEEAISEGHGSFADDAIASNAESSKAKRLATISARAAGLLAMAQYPAEPAKSTKLLRDIRDLYLDVRSLIDDALRAERTLDERKQIADRGFMSQTVLGELRRRFYQLHSDALKQDPLSLKRQ